MLQALALWSLLFRAQLAERYRRDVRSGWAWSFWHPLTGVTHKQHAAELSKLPTVCRCLGEESDVQEPNPRGWRPP